VSLPFLAYFLVLGTDLNQPQTGTVVLLITGFAFAGGFLTTRVFQVHLEARQRVQVAASLSMVYSVAAVLPVMATFVWKYDI
jgi:hypothetical protein